jgi:quinol monooxygenase YgiN
MVHILAKVSIEELPTFMGVFSTRGAEMRRKHGSHRAQIFKAEEQSNQVFLLFEWESREAFEGFRNDPSVRETMQSSGTLGPPEFTFLEKIGELTA